MEEKALETFEIQIQQYRYRCPKGHEWIGYGPLSTVRVGIETADGTLHSDTLCGRCMVEWANQQFGGVVETPVES